jgi:uncharacterized protein (DUF2236 family)
MQNMHPQLGAAVEQFSTFTSEPWPRVLRSLYPIGGVVFDTDRARARAPRFATTTPPSGVDTKGRRFHALNPDVFYWAHSTFFVGTIIVAEKFCGGLTEADKRRLFDEHVAWYRMYGMSMRPVPETWEDFQVYWDRMCREVLEDNKATRDVLALENYPKPPFAMDCRSAMGEDSTERVAPLMVDRRPYDGARAVGSGRPKTSTRRFFGAVPIAFSPPPKRADASPRACWLTRVIGRSVGTPA